MRKAKFISTQFLALAMAGQSLVWHPLWADEPAATYDVIPIPLQFEGEGEEEFPASPTPSSQHLPPDASIVPREQAAAPSFELTPPKRVDPFSQPGFDPFDDDQFAPQGTSRSETTPHTPANSNRTLRPTQIVPQEDLNQSFAPQAPVAADGRETIRERYPNGAVKIEREMIQDTDGNYLLDGSWRWYSPKGEIIAQGEYVRDQRHGDWRRIYAANEEPLLKAAPYNQFRAPFHSEAVFQHGKLNGPWTIYDSQQRKVSEIFFENGERHGPAMWWDVRGTPKIQANFVHGKIDGETYVFDSAGKIIRRDRYENGWRYERRVAKYSNGKVKEVSQWLAGKWTLDGDDDWWNARIASFEVSDEPQQHGTEVTYYSNGQMQRQRTFDHGKPVGEVSYWHENGQRALTGHFNTDGKADGQWTWWHSNGLRSIAGEYLAGVSQGDWTWWNAEGKISRRGELTEVPPETIATSPGATTLGRPRPVE